MQGRLTALRSAPTSRFALVLSLAATAIGIALTLTQAPPRVVLVGAKPDALLASATAITPTVCQTGETLPAGVSAIRLGVEASFGPEVLVAVYDGSRTLTSGRRSAGWTASTVTVPVRPVARGTGDVKLCFSIPANSGFLQLYGMPTGPRQAATSGAGQHLPGKVSVAYLAGGEGSWWSRALSVARHMGLGHALSGTWVALLLGASMLAVVALLVGLGWRELP
ncbi:MAG TPA: hypothetical protein VIJ50_07965 [Solirubrobacteraceae bacterium]